MCAPLAVLLAIATETISLHAHVCLGVVESLDYGLLTGPNETKSCVRSA